MRDCRLGNVERTLLLVLGLTLASSACSPRLMSPAPRQQLILPRYPAMLRAANVGGTVIVALPMAADGQPARRPSRVIASSHDLFLLSVVNAVAQWRFAPATRRGVAVPDTVTIRFSFLLDSASRCGPSEVTWEGGPRPQLPPTPEPTYSFDPTSLRGTVTACRTTQVRAVVRSSLLDGPRRH